MKHTGIQRVAMALGLILTPVALLSCEDDTFEEIGEELDEIADDVEEGVEDADEAIDDLIDDGDIDRTDDVDDEFALDGRTNGDESRSVWKPL